MDNSIKKEAQIHKISIIKHRVDKSENLDDYVAVESPLQISINHRPISVTMRTPGDDIALALGFLFTEGMIQSYSEVKSASQLEDNIVNIDLNNADLPTASLERNFYTTSSCGVCGKSSVDAILTKSMYPIDPKKISVSDDVLFSLQEKLLQVQSAFESTGGLHASALFHPDGSYIFHYEDVGRHNALDKLIGNALIHDHLPLSNHILLLSGRASFELIQKASMAGIPIIVAVGAPSSLAVELAQSTCQTLIGFLKKSSYNIYTGHDRISKI
ncbi:MAG TPA: formate dehydrogenase accessory sulfurtransferase FdhD [Saprospiraceae bacterium]|nr:formate dehydrogenase accessory sulfurtransferase FdhD [Saprospiraceae bacterium]HMU02540.1 formate dehydrogenase accessory sulfurtransferase FdhD [Saprospiraceae bacterium]